jgi:hypothetical protein
LRNALTPALSGKQACLMRTSAKDVKVAVGTPVTQRPPHRSRRAALPHRAPASGDDAQASSACRTQSRACGRVSRRCVRPLWCSTRFPLASPLLSTPSAGPGAPAPLFEGFVDTMGLSDSLHPYITVVPLGFTVQTWHHSQARCRASRVPHTVFLRMPEVSDPARCMYALP